MDWGGGGYEEGDGRNTKGTHEVVCVGRDERHMPVICWVEDGEVMD